MKSRFDMIIFDLDGTLVNTLTDVSRGINHAVQKMGMPELDEEAIRKAIGPGGDEFIRAVFPQGTEYDSKTFLKYFRSFYDEHCLDSTQPFEGIREVLSRLSFCTLAVATNKPFRHAQKILFGLELLRYFSALFTPDNGVQEKPNPEMVFSLLDRFNKDSKRTLLVGDTVRDLEAGRQAGVNVCGVKYGYGESQTLKDLCPDFLIDSPMELLDIVLNSSN